MLFALSTRVHTEGGKTRKLATAQRPSDEELTCVEYRTRGEMEDDFDLRADQNVLGEVKSGGLCWDAGVTEGFMLVFVDERRVNALDVEEGLDGRKVARRVNALDVEEGLDGRKGGNSSCSAVNTS